MGEAVVHLARPTISDDEVVATEHGEMLREVRGFETGVGEQFGDRDLIGPRQDLEHTHSHRMGETFEEIGLDFVERSLVVEWFHDFIISTYRVTGLFRSPSPQTTGSQDSSSERADTSAMTDGPKILIVDDEPNIRDLLTTSLRFAGFAVRAVGNGAQAISAVLEEEPDLIILDVMLPDMNGFGVTKRLRASGYTAPILFLTAKDDTEDKITGLTVGGDDYVTKPFSLDEIVARIKAILRRTMHDEEDAVIRAGELTMDQDTHEVTVGPESVELSPTEFKLLRYLMLNPNRVLSKAQILDHVWEYDFNGDAGIVESYISYLRRKLDQHSTEPMIQTKRGFGYMLKAAKV